MQRRTLLAGMGAAAAGLTVSSAANGQAKSHTPARHELDAWMGEISGSHRAFIDSASAVGGAQALHFGRNILNAHGEAYDGQDSDYAMIVCLRHAATVFAYGDAVWKKYGKVFYRISQFADPLTEAAPDINLLQASGRPMMPNRGATIDYLRGRGVQFAICNAATRTFSRAVASAGHGEADDIYNELVESASPDSHFVAAGVLAATRAQ